MTPLEFENMTGETSAERDYKKGNLIYTYSSLPLKVFAEYYRDGKFYEIALECARMASKFDNNCKLYQEQIRILEGAVDDQDKRISELMQERDLYRRDLFLQKISGKLTPSEVIELRKWMDLTNENE